MKNNIRYRFADVQDLDAIYQYLLSMAQEQGVAERFSQTKDSLSKALFSNNPLAIVLIAEMDGAIAGFCLYSTTHRNFTLFEGPGLYIHDLYVVPQFRRKNIATGLLNEIEKIARQQSFSRIDWVVLKENQGAIAFYDTVKNATLVDYIRYMRILL